MATITKSRSSFEDEIQGALFLSCDGLASARRVSLRLFSLRIIGLIFIHIGSTTTGRQHRYGFKFEEKDDMVSGGDCTLVETWPKVNGGRGFSRSAH